MKTMQIGGTVHRDGWGAEEEEEEGEEEEGEEEVEEEKEEGDEKLEREQMAEELEPVTPGLLVRLRKHAISDRVGLAGTTCPLRQKTRGNSRRNYERAFFLFEGLCAARRVRPKHFQVMLQTCR